MVLWVVQGLLALAYLVAGGIKVAQPIATLSKRMNWVLAVSPALVRFIGAAEVLGAIGLILPLLTNILPWLTPTAAGGLVVVQIAAAGFHASRHEYANIPANIVLLALAAFVLVGRVVLVPA
jgi:hypothetical protein